MPLVKFRQAIRFNLSGYDRLPHVFDAGEHDVSERVAEFVRRNPSVGEVIAGGTQEPAEAELPPPPASAELADLTVAQLKERAREAGIEGASSMKKAELVAALESASIDDSAEEDDEDIGEQEDAGDDGETDDEDPGSE